MGGSGWTDDLRRNRNSRQGEEEYDNPPAPSFANWKWWPHTGRAHQWVLYGIERHGTDSDRLNAVLFRALYEEGANLSLVETLVELGRKVFPNCNAAALRDYLLHNQGHGQVQQEIAEGRLKYKIRSVPYFVIGTLDGSDRRPYGFSGAQPSSTFTDIFRELAAADDDE